MADVLMLKGNPGVQVLHIFDEDAGKGDEAGSYEEQTVLALRQRRAALAGLYHALPLYASPAFWQALDDPALPLEVLVRVLRERALAFADREGQQRICAEIIQRVQELNLLWARQALRLVPMGATERHMLASDLCADLHECLLRALADPARGFWEENFLHALSFERKHTLRTFMIREGFWTAPGTLRGTRVPRAYVDSLDAVPLTGWEIEDSAVQELFQAVEHGELLLAVLQLPEKLKAIVLLLFWEERTEKEAACILAISDRTVRNRLHAALRLLRALLFPEREENLSHA